MGQEMATYPDGYDSEPGVRNIYFEYSVGAANAITAVRFNGLAPTPFVRTGVGVVDFFFANPPFKVLNWSIMYILATPGNVTLAGTGEPTVIDNSTPALGSKLTITHRRNDTLAATDLANGDVCKGVLQVKYTGAGT